MTELLIFLAIFVPGYCAAEWWHVRQLGKIYREDIKRQYRAMGLVATDKGRACGRCPSSSKSVT